LPTTSLYLFKQHAPPDIYFSLELETLFFHKFLVLSFDILTL